VVFRRQTETAAQAAYSYSQGATNNQYPRVAHYAAGHAQQAVYLPFRASVHTQPGRVYACRCKPIHTPSCGIHVPPLQDTHGEFFIVHAAAGAIQPGAERRSHSFAFLFMSHTYFTCHSPLTRGGRTQPGGGGRVRENLGRSDAKVAVALAPRGCSLASLFPSLFPSLFRSLFLVSLFRSLFLPQAASSAARWTCGAPRMACGPTAARPSSPRTLRCASCEPVGSWLAGGWLAGGWLVGAVKEPFHDCLCNGLRSGRALPCPLSRDSPLPPLGPQARASCTCGRRAATTRGCRWGSLPHMQRGVAAARIHTHSRTSKKRVVPAALCDPCLRGSD
jgi:hypothetical protein